MKRTVLLMPFLVLLTLLSLSSWSCSHSKSPGTQTSGGSNSIVGEWVEYDPDDPYAEDYITNHLIFYANGTGYWKLMGDLHSPNVVRGCGHFRWEKNGNTIGIYESDGNYYQIAYHGKELVRTGGLCVETYRKKR